MKCIEAKKLLEDIDRSIVDIKRFKEASDLEKSYLAKFLVVYISGVYEEAIECILNERITILGSEKLNKFFESYIDRFFRNPDAENINRLLGLFDEDWKKEIKKLPNKTKQSLSNILTNKNALAHGTLCSVTLEEVIRFYDESRQVIEKIDDIVQFSR